MIEKGGKKKMGEAGLVRLPRFVCERCNHKWTARINKKPKVCSNCKSPYWDKPRRNNNSSSKKHEK